MASSCLHAILLFSLLFISSTIVHAQTSFRPKGLILPVTKDASTLQYLTQISQRTPLVPVSLTLDLGGQFLWVDCDQGYVSSSYIPARCRSAKCSLAGSSGCGDCFSPPSPGCNNNTCGAFPDNSITRTATSGELASDIVSVQSSNGKNPGRNVSDKDFLFVCGATFLLNGLASGVKGMAGLGRTRISLPSQFSAEFSFPRKFAVCLSSTSNSKGVVLFGDGPYSFLPNREYSSDDFSYTPLFINPVSTASAFSSGTPSSEYFIGVKSIKINEKVVPINTTLLSIDSQGVGGTKISTVNPYTILETSIYNAVTNFFVKELAIPTVPSVAPFGVCFDSRNITSTRVGPGVPSIDLVLQNENVFWRIFGANSMVLVSENVLCLGFVDGGVNPRTSIVIGGHTIEDNLLQFDLAASRLGFTSSILFRQTTCANFNFTSIA
uniref:Xyloglucanase-specific endoglucanase inhibitor protein n=1 Tax=Petunia hybrida TaxID=4102 RepID=B9VUV0_PETHY|nr:xyloglucanase-specific endoglucanase inhibitor protein [Petunia x hybrida]